MYFMSEIECVQQQKKGDGSFENYQNEKTSLFCVKYKAI
jgi:hypothetical protein